MRRFSIAAIAAITAALAVAGVAFAANQYGLPTASTAPKGVGSSSKPFPTGVKFGVSVKDSAGPRGAPIEKYRIAFQGLTAKYAKKLKTCKFADTTADAPLATINQKCKKAKVGSGRVETLVAPEQVNGQPNTNPNDVSFFCNLQLSLYNIGNGLSIRLDADNTTQPTSQDGPIGCIVPTHRAIQSKFKNIKLGGVRTVALDFTVPLDLRHNSGLILTVASISASVKKVTGKAKVSGKKRRVGLFSSIGCGKGKKREIQATFTDENGARSKVTKKTRC